jgi:NAD(P)-dependent dehydrogenase (short-subunit alcohol dehydrogenase family)
MTTASRPVALITGGTTGIGLAAARHLHGLGFAVVVTGRNPDTLAEAARALPDDVVVIRADARSVSDAEQLAAELTRRFGKLDVVFLNAGVAHFAPLESFDEAFFTEHFDINVKGALFTLQKVLPLLVRGSSVILTSSVVAEKGLANASVYSATKAAVNSLVRSLSVELAPRGIRVNGISPGPIETPIMAKLGMPAEALDGFKQTMTARVPLARFGSDDEVARTVGFLATPASSFVTGAQLAVDGGMAAT